MTKDNEPTQESFPGRGRSISSATATLDFRLLPAQETQADNAQGQPGHLLHNPGLITPDDNVTPVPSEAGEGQEAAAVEEHEETPGEEHGDPLMPEDQESIGSDTSTGLAENIASTEHTIHCPSGVGMAYAAGALALLVGCAYANYGSH